MSYSYKEFFHQLYRSSPPAHSCQAADSKSHVLWKKESREHLAKLSGLTHLEPFIADSPSCCRDVKCLETVRGDGYTRYKMEFQTLPGIQMPFYMLVPETCSPSRPNKAMIAIPAHGASKESVAGVLSSPGVKEKLQKTPKENYGQHFVRNGYIVSVPIRQATENDSSLYRWKTALFFQTLCPIPWDPPAKI